MDDEFFWTHESRDKIEEWLQHTRPSIVTDDQTPWIWVRGTLPLREDPERNTAHPEALVKAHAILDKLSSRLETNQSDDAIPVRGKKGVKSKKQVREEAHEEAKTQLEELSKQSEWTVGKWLFFPRHDRVDGMWATIAQSVANGPLKAAGVDLVKVAPSPRYVREGEEPSHVICVYMDNVYDKAAVTKVLTTLLRDHGLEPTACKSDLYTLAGIDSKHPSGLRSSIWRPAELVDTNVIRVGSMVGLLLLMTEITGRILDEEEGR
ncbi:hypothetical protein DB88DRAFT_477385 [Papiliotrema laurentii]|uniref:Uncharacterized protein n=1 Tax=Papiliotrema laurentii TaxID=5418 RepID=A0AAD9FW25_PAPLA|nr:hypothetical protein DB88DRAFT_477385 [Papiliotrema laurentii]